ncbi:MAG: hypothetical protein IH857_04435 [Deltaproteobacteria bacterium]|nr:hypothetical protein [Deltaproteobacteria bacterium]
MDKRGTRSVKAKNHADRVISPIFPLIDGLKTGARGEMSIAAGSSGFHRQIEQSEKSEKTRRQKMEEYAKRFSGPFEALYKQFAPKV